MNILVTGGCGFIGSNFVRMALDMGTEHNIINIDKLTYAGNLGNLEGYNKKYLSRYSFVKADIADREKMKKAFSAMPIDAVIHFAAESHVDRSIADSTPFIQTNIMGTQVLLEVAREAKVKRFVHVSTDEVYGSLNPEEKAFTENSHIQPNSPYSASKAASDLLVRAAHETFGQDVVITRCSNNYGQFQFPEKLIPLMVQKAKHNQSLPVYGNGKNVRDWIHVEDHCRGVYLALIKGKSGEVYNFGGNAEKENIEVVETILRLMNKPSTLINYVKDRPGHDLRYAMDFSKARKELGFMPKHTFEKGLEQTVQWYLDNPVWVDNVLSGEYRAFEKKWYGERV